jgi:hypothetical protein
MSTVPFLENIKSAQRQIVDNYDTMIATCNTYIEKGIDKDFYSSIKARSERNRQQILLSIKKT